MSSALCIPGTTCRFEETLFQSTADGKPFVDVLKEQGIMAGIKVDTGLTALPRTKNETATTGLDGLPDRCARYYEQGARFAKWRAVMRIDKADGAPSDAAILENTHALARYAQISQAAGLVPIVEPEILMDGDHDIETTAYYTERVLSFTFRALNEYDVCLDAALLKPNMVRMTSALQNMVWMYARWLTVLCVPCLCPSSMMQLVRLQRCPGSDGGSVLYLARVRSSSLWFLSPWVLL